MFLNKKVLLFLLAAAIVGILVSSCVDIPSSAPTIPNYKSEMRFISLNPSSIGAPTNLKMAEGADTLYVSSLAIGSNGTESAFQTFNAGTKHLIYFTDTLAVSFETDTRAMLIFYRNLKPDSTLDPGTGTMISTKSKFDLMKLSIRNTFQSNFGLQDTAMVRFTNLVRLAKNAITIWRDSLTAPTGSISTLQNILFGKTSAVYKIPRNKTYNFFITYPTGDTLVYKNPVSITGASNKLYDVVVYDQFDTTATPNANVKVKVLDEY